MRQTSTCWAIVQLVSRFTWVRRSKIKILPQASCSAILHFIWCHISKLRMRTISNFRKLLNTGSFISELQFLLCCKVVVKQQVWNLEFGELHGLSHRRFLISCWLFDINTIEGRCAGSYEFPCLFGLAGLALALIVQLRILSQHKVHVRIESSVVEILLQARVWLSQIAIISCFKLTSRSCPSLNLRCQPTSLRSRYWFAAH